MEEIKKVNDIYNEYFNLIDSYFGSIKHHLGNEEDSHIDLGRNIASYPLIADLIIDSIDDIDVEINNFWLKNAPILFEYIKKQSTLKCLYSGDITPFVLENFVKKSALYIDTVILPDPLFNLSLFQKQIILNKRYYLQKMIRHIFNIWKLKDLVMTKISEKIILIAPISISIIEQGKKDKLIEAGNKGFTEYSSKVFGQKFQDEQECLAFSKKQNSIQDLHNNIKKPSLLPSSLQTEKSFNVFMDNFMSTKEMTKFDSESYGYNFGVYLQSQFMRVQEHKYFCNKIIAEPIYDYELPWFFFNYEMGGLDMDAAISNALHKEKFCWINNMPLEAIKVFREENNLEYMRAVLRQGITDLKARNDKDLTIVSVQMEENFKEAFKKQAAELKELNKKANAIVKKEIPISVGGFLAGFVPYVSNIVSLVCAGRDVKKALEERETLLKTKGQKDKNLISLMVKSYDE